MSIFDKISQLNAQIKLCESNIGSCERALECADQFHVEPFIHTINWLGVRNGKSGAVTINNSIAYQAISLQLEAYKHQLVMLKKELSNLINSNQF